MSKLGFTIRRRGRISKLLPRRRQGRKPAIGRIHDQRRALGPDNRISTVVPELVVGNDAARRVLQAAFRRIDEIAILATVFFAFKDRGFLTCQKRFVREGTGPFQRRDGAVIPNALEVGVTAWCPRRFPRFRDGRRSGIRWRGPVLLTASGFRNRNEAQGQSDDREAGQFGKNRTAHASLQRQSWLSAATEIITMS